MANVAPIKKRRSSPVERPVECPTTDWTLYRACSRWDEADIYRTSIVVHAGWSARIRYEGGSHLVEWKR